MTKHKRSELAYGANQAIGWRNPLLYLWLGLVALSSTSIAGRWADSTFLRLASQVPLLHFQSLDPYRRWTIHFFFEKDVHLFLYTVLAVLLYRATSRPVPRPFFVLGICTSIGILSELLQRCFPGRDPSIRDVGINILGTCVGLSICWLVAKINQRVFHSPVHP